MTDYKIVLKEVGKITKTVFRHLWKFLCGSCSRCLYATKIFGNMLFKAGFFLISVGGVIGGCALFGLLLHIIFQRDCLRCRVNGLFNGYKYD